MGIKGIPGPWFFRSRTGPHEDGLYEWRFTRLVPDHPDTSEVNTEERTLLAEADAYSTDPNVPQSLPD
jgi:hypothetical protein